MRQPGERRIETSHRAQVTVLSHEIIELFRVIWLPSQKSMKARDKLRSFLLICTYILISPLEPRTIMPSRDTHSNINDQLFRE